MKNVIRLFYGYQFFFSLFFWLPVFYEYQKRIGLNDEQIFGIQSLYYVAFCLLEIPTGMLADRFGHRRCMRGGAFILVIANLLPIFVQTYTGFLMHFMLIALARSLNSGASSAYIFEYLHENKAGDIYKEIEGKARAYGLFGKVACWAAVGPLMEWHFTMPYWLTAVATGFSFVMAMGLPDVRSLTVVGKKTLIKIEENWGARIRGLALSLKKTPFLGFLMIQGVAIFALSRICQVNLFQPILQSKNFGLTSFGLVMSLMTVFEALGSLKPLWFRRLMTDFNAVYFLTFVMALSLGLIPLAGPNATIVSLCIFSLAVGFSYPIQRQLINNAVPDSKYRATVLSMESILDRAVNAGVAALVGGFLATGRLSEFLFLCGAITIGGLALLMIAGRFAFSREQIK